MHAYNNKQHPDSNPLAVGDDVERPATDRTHPRIYAILIALTAWFVFALWSFAGGGITDYLLFIVSGFIFVVVTLSLILLSVKRRDATVKGKAAEPPLREWAKWNYETWTGPLIGTQAATQILLPVAAAALGMSMFGIAFLVAEHGA
jgi:hypothetical protein